MQFWKYTLLSLLVLLSMSTYAQEKLLIGQWQDHLNLRESFWVTQSDEHVIVSTGKALIYIDKEELSYETFSKVDNLNDAEITIIKYDKINKQLFVIYKNGAFDIIDDEGTEYITAIKDNTNILGSKTITDIHFTDGNSVYFSTAFGIIEFNLSRREFSSTTFTVNGVNAITSDENFIYAALEDGLYSINKTNNNKENFSNWQLLGAANGLPALYKSINTENFNGDLYAVIDNAVYRRNVNQSNFEKIDISIPSGYFIEWISAEMNHIIFGLKNNSTGSETRFIDKNRNIISGGANCINRTIYGIEDEQGRIWYADMWRAIRYTDNPTSGCKRIEYNSPYAFESSHIETDGDKIYFASGGATESFGIKFSRAGFYILEENGNWTNVNEEFFPIINEKGFFDFQTVAPHPSDKDKLYVGSYLNGLVEYKISDKTMKFYGESTNPKVLPSALQAIVGAAGQVRISYLKFDEDENLWIANYGAPEPIVVFTKDSTWHTFDTPSDNGLLTTFTIDENNNKWFATRGPSSSIIVFNENGTFDDKSDDRLRVINSSNSLLNTQVNCAVVDLNGSVWVGTSEGPVVFDCDPFDTDCGGGQVKVLEDSIPALLLVTEDILCIEIDGANRKWFGTRNGIFVQSPNGEILEYRYTIDNSPLFSNIVYDMDFHSETGLMYISTALGIQSLKTDATTGTNAHSSNVFAYPNPIRPNYNGPIAIKGLARDADVKITDMNGRLVYKTKANGGQAIWDGNDYNGRRADTGTYLIFSASEQNPERKDAIVSKILVVK